jgi:hypothetical protein
VWRIEQKLGTQQATRNRLSKALAMKPSYLGRVVSRITEISKDCYLKPHRLHSRAEGRRPGPPHIYYDLIGERLATFPETALLLLELMASPKELPGRINYPEFVARMTNISDLTEDTIKTRIQWAMENDYLIMDDAGDYIASLERSAHERPYLERLASHFNKKSA